MSLLDTMKKVAQQSQNASVPAAFIFGNVTALSPVTIRVDNRFDITGEAVILMQEFQTGSSSRLDIGDKVVLFRNQGGQSFLVLGRV